MLKFDRCGGGGGAMMGTGGEGSLIGCTQKRQGGLISKDGRTLQHTAWAARGPLQVQNTGMKQTVRRFWGPSGEPLRCTVWKEETSDSVKTDSQICLTIHMSASSGCLVVELSEKITKAYKFKIDSSWSSDSGNSAANKHAEIVRTNKLCKDCEAATLFQKCRWSTDLLSPQWGVPYWTKSCRTTENLNRPEERTELFCKSKKREKKVLCDLNGALKRDLSDSSSQRQRPIFHCCLF